MIASSPVVWTGHRLPNVDGDGALSMVPYRIDRLHNQPWHIAKVEPSGGMRGPARELGRFYESLLGHGSTRVLEPRTVEVMGAVHRHGLRDPLFGHAPPFGLGVAVDFTGGAGRRAYGHGGMASSRGLRRSGMRSGDGRGLQRASRPDRRGAPERRGHRRGLHRPRRSRRSLPPDAPVPSERPRSLRSRSCRGDDLEDARVHCRGPRHDVTGLDPLSLVTLPVGDDATGLAHDQPTAATSHVPRLCSK